MKIDEIADRIYKHLKRIEDNKLNKNFNLYQVNVWGTTKVWIRYVNYWSEQPLTKAEALKYLEWLDKGNVGSHFKALE